MKQEVFLYRSEFRNGKYRPYRPVRNGIDSPVLGLLAKMKYMLIPFPAQGHVAPLMKLSHQIVDYGIKFTFVSTEFINAILTTTMPVNSPIRLVSLSDGLEPGDDQTDALKLINSFREVKPDHFKDLIEKINESDDDDRIICVIADVTVAWAFDVAEKIGIQSAAFWPNVPATLALILLIPKLIEDGIIDTQGNN